MTPPNASAPSTWPHLLLLAGALSALALTACSSGSTRPLPRPTPPPLVTCDQTQAARPLPPLPPLRGAADLVATDTWISDTAGLYQAEVTLRQLEHQCLQQLRDKGVIR